METETINLRHVKIHGFKSIAQLNMPLDKVNILIGANGAGKSNFVSLFTFLSHLAQEKLRHYVKIEGGAERFFHFGTRHSQQIIVELQVGNHAYHVKFSPNLTDDALVFEEEYCASPASTQKWYLSPKRGESGFASDTSANSDGVQKYLEECRVYHFQDTSSQASFKKTQKLVDYAFLQKDAANLAPFLYHLKKNSNAEYRRAYQQIVKAIQSVAPFFHDFYLNPTGDNGDGNILLRWTHTHHEAPFSAHVFSDGTARFICMATLFLQPRDLRPDTIILDEPELGLHPAALEILADIIQTVSQETQVICSTQSVTFANFFEPEDFIVVDAEKGVSTFRRLEPAQFEPWLEEYGMGDVWSKNLIGGRPAW